MGLIPEGILIGGYSCDVEVFRRITLNLRRYVIRSEAARAEVGALMRAEKHSAIVKVNLWMGGYRGLPGEGIGDMGRGRFTCEFDVQCSGYGIAGIFPLRRNLPFLNLASLGIGKHKYLWVANGENDGGIESICLIASGFHFAQLALHHISLTLQLRNSLICLSTSLFQLIPLETSYDSAKYGRSYERARPPNELPSPFAKVWVSYVYGIAGATCLGVGWFAICRMIRDEPGTCASFRDWIVGLCWLAVAVFVAYHGVLFF